ncbi:MAG TPA: 2,3-bisphosphoglycerate-independent phosphoglycerate mutase [Streptosporangiaceae bacterium]|nr:2,3-bisphosphoglycerate-independent phosphoglycerate mutase [Streptosporangiaceae bacterium]
MNAGILLVLDGWGSAPPGPSNAIATARTPALDHLLATSMVRFLDASGTAVGLPERTVGNSEIGHLVIGAGRPLEYDSLLVEKEAKAGRLRAHPLLAATCKDLAASGGSLHLIGLVSDGRIHADIAHFQDLLNAAADAGLRRVLVHAITDGRDVPNGTAAGYLDELAGMIAAAGIGEVASLIGRNYAMDKSGAAELTRQACDLMIDASAGRRFATVAHVLPAYAGDDGSLPATAIAGTAGPVADGDAILFVNFRSDRTAPLADMIASRLAETRRSAVTLLSLAEYDTSHPVAALVRRADASGGLSDALGGAAIKSVRIAEREKFEHVTFFINGRGSAPRPLDEHICVTGDNLPDYVRVPEMNVADVARRVAEAARRQDAGLVLANLANIDVVGHTGDYAATVSATEAVDAAVAQVAAAAIQTGRWLMIVGDHGNGEQMTKPDACGADRPYGGHTTNPVPFVIAGTAARTGTTPPGIAGACTTGTLADVAPTVLTLLGCQPAPAMTGRSLC